MTLAARQPPYGCEQTSNGEGEWATCCGGRRDLAIERRGGVIRSAMPSKRSAKDRAAEQADFKTWLADAVAELQRQHNINPAIIPQRMWRHLYIQGRSPQKAADQAAVSAYNTQSAAARLRKR
jgi:hypothetical protein